MKSIKIGAHVVCLGSDFKPSTWGTVMDRNGDSVRVRYGEDAPIWSSPFWDITYLEGFETEEIARKTVRDYEDSLPNR